MIPEIQSILERTKSGEITWKQQLRCIPFIGAEFITYVTEDSSLGGCIKPELTSSKDLFAVKLEFGTDEYFSDTDYFSIEEGMKLWNVITNIGR